MQAIRSVPSSEPLWLALLHCGSLFTPYANMLSQTFLMGYHTTLPPLSMLHE